MGRQFFLLGARRRQRCAAAEEERGDGRRSVENMLRKSAEARVGTERKKSE